MNIGIIIAIIAVLLSGFALSLHFFRNKRAIEGLRSRNSEFKKRLDYLQREIGLIKEQSARERPVLIRAESIFREVALLRTELGSVQRDLQANSLKLTNQSQVRESIQKEAFLTEAQWNPAGLNSEQSAQSNENLQLAEVQAPRPPEPYEQATQQYQDALDRGDRQAIRQMQVKELNITTESEDLLIKGGSGQATKLQAVPGGGSYVLMISEGRYWLFPTTQTLDSFSMHQPQKGIFRYEREILSRPVVKKPAEVREEGDYWVVVGQGVISVPT